MFIKNRTFKINWNYYLIKAIKFQIKFKVILKKDNRWISVKIKWSLILKIVKN